MENSLEILLKEGAAHFGLQLSDTEVSAFNLYKNLLSEWNQKINLTAIEDDKDVITKHFIDSLSIIPFLKNVRNIIDVGTGAGFPGLPVKIVRPELEVVLLDSLEKRIGFLNTVIGELHMDKITAIHSRAEDAGNSPKYREKFDVATARAVASLPVLLEYCMPLIKTGGIFIAMKGSSLSEADEAGKALDILGGDIEEVKEFTLPGSDIKRNIIVIKKLRQTPTKYPRKAGKPSREPLI
jgi:16S rRNA (guanine527-N7)-methyltransferase